MKMNHCLLIPALLLGGLTTLDAQAAPRVGTVIVLKGKAFVKSKGTKAKRLSEGTKVSEGQTISTAFRSHVKILFNDKTTVSVGPKTRFKIDRFKQKKSKVMTLINGQARLKVNRDFLSKKVKKRRKSKLYLRTKTATMGVRGTEFQAVYNDKNQVTSTVTFEGEVGMVKNNVPYAPGDQSMGEALASDQSVAILKGQYSGVSPVQEQATVPVKISPAQFEALRTNTTFSDRKATAAASDKFISPIPPGVDAKNFANSSDELGGQLAANTGLQQQTLEQSLAGPDGTGEPGGPGGPDGNQPPPEGFFDADTGAAAPPAGGFIDVDTGLYVPPPPGSTFDANTGVFTPPPSFGGFDANTGAYVPPKGFELDPTKGFVAAPKPGERRQRSVDPNQAGPGGAGIPDLPEGDTAPGAPGPGGPEGFGNSEGFGSNLFGFGSAAEGFEDRAQNFDPNFSGFAGPGGPGELADYRPQGGPGGPGFPGGPFPGGGGFYDPNNPGAGLPGDPNDPFGGPGGPGDPFGGPGLPGDPNDPLAGGPLPGDPTGGGCDQQCQDANNATATKVHFNITVQ